MSSEMTTFEECKSCHSMKRVVGFLAIGLMVLTGACEKLPDDKPTPTPPTPTPVAVSSVSLNQSSVDLKVGESVTLTATVQPSNATDKNVTWTSSDASVASVSGGVVKAVKEGSASITATAGGKSASCSVKVSPNVVAVTGVSLNQKDLTLKVGETAQLTATVTPDNATDKTVKWSSSDLTKATVDDKGLVTAVSPGTCVISAASGSITANCNVTIVVAGGNEDYGYENLKK